MRVDIIFDEINVTLNRNMALDVDIVPAAVAAAEAAEQSAQEAAAYAAAAASHTAEAYDATKTYAVGEYCVYNSKLYVCKTAITTAEAWTAAHWTEVTVGEALTTLKEDLTLISASNRNLWEGLASETFVTSKTVTFATPLPAGTYTLSATPTSTDTDITVCRFQVNSSSTIKDLNRGTRNSKTFTFESQIESITLWASTKSTYSSGDTATWANIQLEAGDVMSTYIPHATTAKDTVARGKIDLLVKYVSTTGNDSNDGNTPSSAYATLGKALSETADVIMVAKGTYTQSEFGEFTAYRYGKVKIIGDNAVINCSTNGLYFRQTHVEISGLTFDATNASSNTSYGMFLHNCTGTVTDCVAIGGKGAGCFRLDGSKLTLNRCVAYNGAVDGFNGHTLTTGYDAEITLIDCVAHDNGDDGASVHEAGKMYIIGGEYYNNTQAGLAPHDNCDLEAYNVFCHDNSIGLEAINESAGTGRGKVFGCVFADNGVGISVKNYTIYTLANGFSGNTTKINESTGAVITAYTAE